MNIKNLQKYYNNNTLRIPKKVSESLLILLFLFVFKSALAQNAVIYERIKSELIKWDQNIPTKSSHLGFCLRDINSGNVILEFNSGKSMMPASNLKLLTTASGLEVLGEDYAFETRLGYNGIVQKNGVLKGDIYIIGGGDPTLGSSRMAGNPDFLTLFKIFTDKIKQTGITKIEGRVIADGSLFGIENTPDAWGWGDIGNYYGALSCGLNLNENLYLLKFRPGKKEGDSTEILGTDPVIPGQVFLNTVTTGSHGSGDNAYIYGGPFTNLNYVTGTIPPGTASFTIKGSIPDPIMFTAVSFSDYLKKSGIQITDTPIAIRIPGNSPQALTMLYLHKSPLLKDIVYHTNLKSINLYAESIFNIINVMHEGNSQPSHNSFLRKIWGENFVDTVGLKVEDGSGLAFNNLISCSQLTHLLCIVYNKKYFNTFKNSLPVSGKTGTLARLTKGTTAEGVILAKTGTQTGVAGYSGYVTGKNGITYAFSIIINGMDDVSKKMVSPFIEKIFVQMALLK